MSCPSFSYTLYKRPKVKALIKFLFFLFFQCYGEESQPTEGTRRSQLQYARGSPFRDHALETENKTAEFFYGTDVNHTVNSTIRSYNGTYVNHTGNWRMGVSKGTREEHMRNLRSGASEGKHHGTFRNRWSWRRWNCNRTCANNTSVWRPVNCNRTCANRTCGWRTGCNNNTWNWWPGNCGRIFGVLIYNTWNWRPGNPNGALVNHVGTWVAKVSNGTRHESNRNHTALKH
jgi:hypothetical protein